MNENAYSASTPVQVSSGNAGTGELTTSSIDSPGQLNIYEVDFDNNVAYIVPSVSSSAKNSESKEDDDAEIYHVLI